MTVPNYLSGKPSAGAWKHQPRKTPPPPNRPFLERNSRKLLVICLSGLIALAVASWGAPKLFGAINSYIEMGVD